MRSTIAGIGSIALMGCGGTPTIVLTDAENYGFTSELTATCQPVKPASDLTITWADLDEDLLGGPIVPTTDIDALTLARFAGLSQADVLAGINGGVLAQRDVTAFANIEPVDGATSAALSGFATVGTPLDVSVLTPDAGTFLLDAARRAPDGRETYLTFTFLCPAFDETNTTVVLSRDTASLSYEVDLRSLAPIALGSADDALIDWSDLTRAGNGGALVPFDIDRMRLVRYDADLAALEADLLDAVTAAAWSADVGGWGDWLLSDLVDADGAPFEGFADPGLYWVALDCTTCLNPAPLFLGQLAR